MRDRSEKLATISLYITNTEKKKNPYILTYIKYVVWRKENLIILDQMINFKTAWKKKKEHIK